MAGMALLRIGPRMGSAEIEALVREKAQAAKDGEDEFEGDEDGLDIRLMDDEDEEGQLDLEGLGGDDE